MQENYHFFGKKCVLRAFFLIFRKNSVEYRNSIFIRGWAQFSGGAQHTKHDCIGISIFKTQDHWWSRQLRPKAVREVRLVHSVLGRRPYTHIERVALATLRPKADSSSSNMVQLCVLLQFAKVQENWHFFRKNEKNARFSRKMAKTAQNRRYFNFAQKLAFFWQKCLKTRVFRVFWLKQRTIGRCTQNCKFFRKKWKLRAF